MDHQVFSWYNCDSVLIKWTNDNTLSMPSEIPLQEVPFVSCRSFRTAVLFSGNPAYVLKLAYLKAWCFIIPSLTSPAVIPPDIRAKNPQEEVPGSHLAGGEALREVPAFDALSQVNMIAESDHVGVVFWLRPCCTVEERNISSSLRKGNTRLLRGPLFGRLFSSFCAMLFLRQNSQLEIFSPTCVTRFEDMWEFETYLEWIFEQLGFLVLSWFKNDCCAVRVPPIHTKEVYLWWLKQTTREVHTRPRQEVCATALRRSVVSSLDHQLHQRCNQSASKAYGPMGLKVSHCCPPSTMDLGTQIKKNCCETKHRLLWMQHDVACKASEFGPQSTHCS